MMMISSLPSQRTLRPDFRRANRRANDVLWELNYPKPPIPLMELIHRRKWHVDYQSLEGIDGQTVKIQAKDGKMKYYIFLADDHLGAYNEVTMRRRQFYTLAHEIGHIILHQYVDWDNLTAEEKGIMEVEANWFASRLLMPDYIFETIDDLKPDKLAERCFVNISAAKKRILRLSEPIRNDILNHHYGYSPVDIEPIDNFTIYDDLFDLINYDIQMKENDVPTHSPRVDIKIVDRITLQFGDYIRELAATSDTDRTCFSCNRRFPILYHMPKNLCTYCGGRLIIELQY